jgi:glycine betaine/choline ABC-type transport system substrate-binding protein
VRPALLLILPLLLACAARRENRIVIGAKNFTEQVVLAEILAQHLELRTELEVERRINLGGTLIAQQAIQSGEIDAFVEYTGTALTVVLGEPPASDKAEVFRRVKEGYAARFGLEVLEPLGFENTFAIVVRGEDARRLKLRKISDIQPYARMWRGGFGYEFAERRDGYRGFVEKYGLKFELAPRTLDLGLLYRALIEKQVDIVAGNSTDGAIASLDLAVLEDDRHYFPPYEAVPIVRPPMLAAHPEVRRAVDALAGKFSEAEMQRLNYQVDGEHKDVKELVRDFLRSKGL